MKKLVLAIILMSFEIISFAQEFGQVTDLRDGRTYKTVKIGKQVWMAENLNFEFGKNVTEKPVWSKLDLKDSAWCYFNNNPDNGKTYGSLYTYSAAIVVCPSGWHLPSNEEWESLITYLGGIDVVGGKLKMNDSTLWVNTNIGATNISGFSGLPGGFRKPRGQFQSGGNKGVWWSSTITDQCEVDVYAYLLEYHGRYIKRVDCFFTYGLSVRCIKD